MSLPTPPKTSHRTEKENRFDARGVTWSSTHEYRGIFALDGLKIPSRTAGRQPPARSILKKRKHAEMLNDTSAAAAPREATPEPEDALMDLEYISRCVGTIMHKDASLRDLIEAYNILAARLRATTPMDADPETSWPLFQPIRKDPQAFADALVRDLNRARVDPTALEEKAASTLPSPKKSPVKRSGLSAEQVKHARDFSMACHAVIKLLCFMFSVPAVMYLFTTAQLGQMLTAVLAIPLSKELPTLNARKTCALAISLLQTQRLPADVLSPAADRIAYALRRGIEGQLGKEGKKGSTSDGLRAIHDLSIYQPDIFVPAFSTILSSVLDAVVGPSLNFRVLACHALGGLAFGASCVQRDHVHTHLADTVITHLQKKCPVSPHKTSASPTSPAIQESPIEKAIRTTIRANTDDAVHIGQTPIWGLCTLASLIVLLGPAVFTDNKIFNIVNSKLTMACNVKKSSVRVLTMAVVRALIWAAFQPPFLLHPDDEDEDGLSEHALSADDDERRWRSISRYAGACGPAAIGTSLCASLLGQEDTTDQDIRRALDVLADMARKPNLSGCVNLLGRMLDSAAPTDSVQSWDPTHLLAEDLFSAYPGLLTSDYNNLKEPVQTVCTQAPVLEDIMPLARDQVLQPWVLEAAESIWLESLKHAKIEGETLPAGHFYVWEMLLKARVAECEESSNEEGLATIAAQLTEVLITIASTSDIVIEAVKHKNNPRLAPIVTKTRLMADLWLALCTHIPREHLVADATRLLNALIDGEEELSEGSEVARQSWARLCARVLSVTDTEDTREFWCQSTRRVSWGWSDETRRMVWREVVDQWRQDPEATWDGDIVLLAVPFTETMAMDLESEDLELWEDFLDHVMRRALDDGCDGADVLEKVATTIFARFNPTSIYNARAADLLLSRLDLSGEARLPSGLFDFVNECMRAAYPPRCQDQAWCTWMLRSLTDVLDKCPGEMLMELLESLEGGLCVWLEDAMSTGEDLTVLYGMILCSVGALPHEQETLERVAPILEAAMLRNEPALEPYVNLFRDDFWVESYGKMDLPKSGWPASVQNCLRAAHLVPAEEAEEESPAGLSLAPSLDIVDSLPAREVLARPISPPPRPCTPTSSFVRTIPETPERDAMPPSSPPGTPFFTVPATMPSTPQSARRTLEPLSPSTPRRALATPFAGRQLVFSSPRKGADEPSDPQTPGMAPAIFYSAKKPKNKENARPRKRTLSAPDAAPSHVALGKRAAPPEDDDAVSENDEAREESRRPTKRLRQSRRHQRTDSHEERTVQALLIPSETESPAPPAPPAKRLVLDAVEVPTLRAVRRRWSGNPMDHKPVAPLRRTQTHPETSDEPATKRRRLTMRDLGFGERVDGLSDPESDDTYDQSSDSSMPSSDDDPHIGQVTPGHLISPHPRGHPDAAWDDEDEDGDDELVDDSPSRRLAARHRRKVPNNLAPIPLKFSV
ncbi:hypothetical protein BD626DRAFT_456663 [Schizophyllum amplum]|uniref:Uncharacterized protein n=1 Tax=Schizophyllum amplum TaxID=97359 RepID=A0A550CHC2_9AGAR|nr:hypothetical protein BD626DRAFT_456663 [Auriculariopsis ampla]